MLIAPAACAAETRSSEIAIATPAAYAIELNRRVPPSAGPSWARISPRNQRKKSVPSAKSVVPGEDRAGVILEELERPGARGVGVRLVGRALQDDDTGYPEDHGRNAVEGREAFLEAVHVAILLPRSMRLATSAAARPHPPAVTTAARAPAVATMRPPTSIAALYAACAAPS